jgi:UDP-GlcNAc3NAcA epimerase
MKKIISIIGARPQFIKHAPIQLQLQKYFTAKTIHTGQHYDANMSNIFFDQLGMAKPDFLFDLAGFSQQGEQTGKMMMEIEKVFLAEKPDACLIYGDTNSTLAGGLVAAKLHIPIIHIEAGLRSFNRSMPEEVNRIVADTFATMLFCPTKNAITNLAAEGITHNKIFLTGDVMCDMVKLMQPRVQRLVNEPYYFATIHRPYNTDDAARLQKIIEVFNALDKPVVFAVHPRTVARLAENNIDVNSFANIHIIEPTGYLDSISYQTFADCVITDSGGIQKEAYILKTRCITLRSETEWTETLEGNWNTLVFSNLDEIPTKLKEPLGTHSELLYGNGNAAAEIVALIQAHL